MGKGYKHGGSNPLNFKVVAYVTEEELNAATPKENTIGVITTTDITGWYFTWEQPDDMAEGEVWFTTSTTSPVKFNAIKKNNVTVYPLSAKQMVSGALKDVTAKSYQNGEWVAWITYLIKGADLCEGVTGGWTSHAKGWSASNNNPCAPTLTKNSDSITLSLSATNWASGIYAANDKINLDNVDKILVDGFGSDVESGGGSLGLVVLSSLGTYSNDNYVASVAIGTEDKTYELPVADLKGEYVIGFRLLSTNTLAATVTIKETRMK